MNKEDVMPPELLRELLRYDPRTGLLYWRERGVHHFSNERYCRMWNKRHSGQLALNCIKKDGYKSGSILGNTYFSHRVIWAMVNDEWPVDQIDHEDHNKLNNRINNFRVATNKDNGQNRSLSKNNTSGFTGVQWIKRSGKWDARITVDGAQKFLGSFVKKQDAITARQAANKKYKYHANHGEPLC